jgi:hypothetical protein
MAKKTTTSLKTEGDKGTLYPWLRLLELEVQPPERSERAMRRGRGRPPNPFPRTGVHVTLTDEELATLDELTELLSSRLGRVHRGHLIAFLIFYLRSRMQKGDHLELPAQVNSLSDLAKYLDSAVLEGVNLSAQKLNLEKR